MRLKMRGVGTDYKAQRARAGSSSTLLDHLFSLTHSHEDCATRPTGLCESSQVLRVPIRTSQVGENNLWRRSYFGATRRFSRSCNRACRICSTLAAKRLRSKTDATSWSPRRPPAFQARSPKPFISFAHFLMASYDGSPLSARSFRSGGVADCRPTAFRSCDHVARILPFETWSFTGWAISRIASQTWRARSRGSTRWGQRSSSSGSFSHPFFHETPSQ